jgi:hypothetical protein
MLCVPRRLLTPCSRLFAALLKDDSSVDPLAAAVGAAARRPADPGRSGLMFSCLPVSTAPLSRGA